MSFGPFSEPNFLFRELQDELNHLMQRAWHGGVLTVPFQQWSPLIDIFEGESHYTVYADLPGVEVSEVEVSQLGSALTIKGERRRPPGSEEADRSVRGERRFGKFCRTVELPSDLEMEKMTAECASGVLRITIPKAASAKARSVKVEVRD